MENETSLQIPSKSRRWGNYLKEFIMIFLAITLGFFVENYREHLAEKDLEREFMQEIVENLKYDTLRFYNNYELNRTILTNFDSLRAELNQAYEDKPNPNRLHHFAFLATELHSLALLNTNAITELRSSGTLRLIHNKKLVANLADYYERRIKALEDIDRPSKELGHEIRQLFARYFSMRNMGEYLNTLDSAQSYSGSSLNVELNKLRNGPPIQNRLENKADIDSYLSTAGLYQIQVMAYQKYLLDGKRAASELMKEIDEEYHFE